MDDKHCPEIVDQEKTNFQQVGAYRSNTHSTCKNANGSHSCLG